mmetsp:Transcript_19893/g.45184  ORF Transcript_19893/g.45184 Transcript_19893/m.45184 type:complete len:206 (-) Transcript_19893:254-871(-)
MFMHNTLLFVFFNYLLLSLVSCAKCDEFAPVWEEFAKDYANDPKYIIAEVDCSADEDFCEGEMDVTEYPSLQYGSHEDILDEYDGSLELEALKEFAAESLALQCSIQFENWCSDEQKELIKRIKAMSSDDLSEKIDEMNDALEVQFSEAEERVEAAEKLMEAATGDDLEKAKRAYEDAERMFDEVIEADQPLELTLMEEYEDMLD